MGAVQAGGEIDTSDHKPVAALLHLSTRLPRPPWWPRAGSAAAAAAAQAMIAAGRSMVPVTWRLEFLHLEVALAVLISPPAASISAARVPLCGGAREMPSGCREATCKQRT